MKSMYDYYWKYAAVSITATSENIEEARKAVGAPVDAEVMINHHNFEFGFDDTVIFRWQEIF